MCFRSLPPGGEGLAEVRDGLSLCVSARCHQGEKDWQKYETARKLHKHVDRIRAQYRQDWKSKEMRIRQRAVAMYFIDKVGGGDRRGVG